jgi:hypothetical protein
MSFTKGIDYFAFPPGEQESMNCGACGQPMKVQRDCTGPTGWAEAIAGGGHPHDSFTCHNSDKKWHAKLVELVVYRNHLPSKKLRAIVDSEIEEIKAGLY